jgi:hypothetical protein
MDDVEVRPADGDVVLRGILRAAGVALRLTPE